MPIYEYSCGQCGHKFEKRRPIDEADSEVSCPACGAKDARKVISAFSCGSGGSDSGGGGSCGPAPSG